MNIKGKFITIEGMDGAGKTTQIRFMKEYLEDRGFKVLLTREPGGTIIGEKIREVILDNSHKEMDSVTEALLYAASRAQHVSQIILPALQRGELVLCDRYVDSSMVYQGKGRDLGYKPIKKINDFATQGLEPDLTILFDIDPQLGLQRISSRGKGDRLEEEKLQFHIAVHSAYMDLVKMYPKRIKVINANCEIQEIKKEVEELLKNIIEEGKDHEIIDCYCS
ncbi:dTMP kinase [Alkaliphilus peptidifermentans]|uniref:Thymidylate kinase n=1 Tax=Alkaliphilus peptidifermentans DSM 18978 TaxID=1120976 RepID=A0A1G5APR5_9FIRM|nr:dTMP kinase [Alkaliphilus peptidifermentans]SCX79865.1 thymidylate kinase [Alkaliphilus peptidifermentans DSM 18978]